MGELLIGFLFVIPLIVLIVAYACQFGSAVCTTAKGGYSAAKREIERRNWEQKELDKIRQKNPYN